jgi:hypothetical protein
MPCKIRSIMKYLIVMLLFVGCGKKQKLELLKGDAGADGKSAHSLVSQLVEVNAGLICPNGGQSLDVYLDLDDSLNVSEEDKFQSSLIACNGENGLQGEQGVQGEQGPQGLQGEVGPQGEAGPQGEPGPIGPQGPQGEAGIPGVAGPEGEAGTTVTIVASGSTSCSAVSGTSYFTKVNGNNVGIFTSSNCHSSSKVEELSEGHSFWFSSNKIGFSLGNDGIRIVTFN